MVKRFVNICAICAAFFFASSIALVVLYRFVPVRYTPLMLIRKAEAFREGYSLDIHQEWVKLEQVSPNLICAVIESEDAQFYQHGGFSFEDMFQAYLLNRRCGYIVAGGSTISQQTAKNVFCTPHRTYTRKLFEAYFTVLIELFWGKNRIMEVYLNVVELGNGVFGIEAAAQHIFATSASQLTYTQSELIANRLPNPRIY